MKPLILAVLLTMIRYPITAQADAKVFTLCLHSFWGTPKNGIFDFSETQLADIVDTFINEGFTFITTEDFLAEKVVGTKNILLTIDDGNRSVYSAYKNVLQPRGIKPLLAIITGSVSVVPQTLTWEQVKELQADGCYIASHSVEHMHITPEAYRKDSGFFLWELRKSKETLYEKLKTPVILYIYPYGAWIPEMQVLIPQEGYVLAFGVDSAPTFLPLRNNPRLWELPRYMLTQKNYRILIDQILRESRYLIQSKL